MSLLHRTFKSRLLARALTSAFVLGAAALPMSLAGVSIVPAAQAQAFDISFDSFHDELSRYGDWVYSDRWGTVWVPDVPRDFHPYYSDGRWERTREYGWTWVSDYEWGDIAFHYGRWVNDIDDGWIWVPGYVWSPGWVVWRGDERYMGWMPMPPDDDFLRGDENISFRFSFGGSVVDFNNYNNGYYGYARWYGRDYDEDRFARNWVFIGAGHIGDRDYRANTVRQPQVVNIIHQTRNVTNYTVINNYIVNRSADGPATRSRVRGSQPAARPAAEVLRRPNFVRNVDAGRQVERRQAQEAPHGRGTANSAPKPQASVAEKLSNRAQPRGGRGSGRLYTRETINNAPGNAVPARLPAAAGAPPVQLTPPGTPQPPVGDNRGRGNRGDRANQDRANQDRANQDRANQDQQNQARDRQAREKQAQEKQAQERQAQEKQAQENQAREKQAQEQRANEQRANEQRANEQRANQQRQAEQERQANEKRANEQRAQQEQQRAQQQKAEQERAQQERTRPPRSAPDQGDAVRAPERPDRGPPAAQAPGTDNRATENRGRGRRNQDDDKKDDKKD